MKAAPAYVLIAGLAIWAAAAARPARRKPKNPLESPKAKPLELAAPLPDHVGQPGYEWPLAHRFVTPSDLQKGLRTLGYELEADDDVLGADSEAAIESFQIDFNLVNRGKDCRRPLLVHGRLDTDSVNALAEAIDLQRSTNTDWFELVADVLEASRPEVG